MGETVEFPSNGSTASGYLATPAEGAGPGVIVVQEWWGLVPQIKRVCDRLATEGFTALAPDLYHGAAAKHTEVDKAGELMMKLPLDRAARDMAGAVDYLQPHDAVRGNGVGVVGFCMGGGLAYVLACNLPDAVKAAVSYYGVIPWGDAAQPDYARLGAAVQGHYAENDDFFPPAAARQLEANLRDLGKEVEFFYYTGAGHGFANDDRADAYDEDAARQAWVRTLEFLRSKLG
jgi:carboxymethylenebutenolidase